MVVQLNQAFIDNNVFQFEVSILQFFLKFKCSVTINCCLQGINWILNIRRPRINAALESQKI